MADESNAGPYTIGVEGTLGANETESYILSEVRAGPTNKKGYLRKLFGDKGGMDYLFIVNASGNVISINTKGGSSLLPPATSQTLDTGPYTSVSVTNEGSSDVNTGGNDQIKVITGNSAREENQGARFSTKDAIQDVIPGVTL